MFNRQAIAHQGEFTIREQWSQGIILYDDKLGR